MSCTLLVRVDCEHVEAARWAGDGAIEAPAARRLFDLLADAGVVATWAFVGETARSHPDLVRAALAGGHEVIGHSMRHVSAYKGQPFEWQLADLTEMVQAIASAGGDLVRGLAAPAHGEIDAGTLRAAREAGLDYVLNFAIVAPGDRFERIDGVLVPPSSMRVIWDWTSLQPGWPDFDETEARRTWRAAIEAGGQVELIVHPWIVETNDEYALLAETFAFARDSGATFGRLGDVAPEEAVLCV